MEKRQGIFLTFELPSMADFPIGDFFWVLKLLFLTLHQGLAICFKDTEAYFHAERNYFNSLPGERQCSTFFYVKWPWRSSWQRTRTKPNWWWECQMRIPHFQLCLMKETRNWSNLGCSAHLNQTQNFFSCLPNKVPDTFWYDFMSCLSRVISTVA